MLEKLRTNYYVKDYIENQPGRGAIRGLPAGPVTEEDRNIFSSVSNIIIL